MTIYPKEVVEDIQQQLAELGMVTPQEGALDQATISNMLAFNLHHLGSQILSNHYSKDMYDYLLWENSSNTDARGLLGVWDKNSQAVLDDILS
ncbi:hypothetical protein [Candidatus Tisiphia endosymbiont of Xenochironomus xenolabis]|uniref:hypothetical protein n=1 Tax=unclassified Candidatus Tisiphia TaxID=2996318 RepID=UPI0035C92570